MDTINEPTAPALKKTIKRRKKSAKPRTEKPASARVSSDEFAGLTAQECCFDCGADRCVISGGNYCGHPAKGGAQPALQRNPDAMNRYHAARKKLAHQATEKRMR